MGLSRNPLIRLLIDCIYVDVRGFKAHNAIPVRVGVVYVLRLA